MSNDYSDLISEQIRIGRSAALSLTGYVLVSTVTYSFIDQYYYELERLFWLSTLFVWVLGYLLLVRLMRAASPQDAKPLGGIGGYFALSFVAGMAVSVGVLLLLLPGLYLLMRWLPAYAYQNAVGSSIGSAMGWSWKQTEAMQKPLIIALVGPVLMSAAAFIIIAVQEFQINELSDSAYSLSMIATNLATTISAAWMQLLGVAAYRVIVWKNEAPTEVFE